MDFMKFWLSIKSQKAFKNKYSKLPPNGIKLSCWHIWSYRIL